MSKPYSYKNWTQAFNWCNRIQEGLRARPFAKGDLRIDHVEPVDTCYVGFSGPGFSTLRLLSRETKEALEAHCEPNARQAREGEKNA